MTDTQVYTNEVVPEQPFPQGQDQNITASQGTSGQAASSPKTKDTVFPVKTMAVELLSTALNTVTKKIQQTFEFTVGGAIQIGQYLQDVSGMIQISPNGIVATNKQGLTSFALDGETGDAIFTGTLRAGATIVSDTIVTEESSHGNGRTVYYNDGLPSIVIGDPS